MKSPFKTICSLGAAAVVGLLVQAAPVQALSFDLNCAITASGCIPTASYGTITVTDSGNSVIVTVDLVGSGANKVLKVDLNTDLNSTGWSVTGGVNNLIASTNGVMADGYSAGRFDLQVPGTGNGGFEPLTFTLSKTSTNLNESNFNPLDSNGLMYAAVHIGSLACTNQAAGLCSPGVRGENSLWVGSRP